MLAQFEAKKKQKLNPEPFLLRKAKRSFYSTSTLDLRRQIGDQDHIQTMLLEALE